MSAEFARNATAFDGFGAMDAASRRSDGAAFLSSLGLHQATTVASKGLSHGTRADIMRVSAGGH